MKMEDLDGFVDGLLSWNATWKLKNDVNFHRQIIYQLANVHEWITEGGYLWGGGAQDAPIMY